MLSIDTPAPKTLQQAIVYFADPDNCLRYLAERRWPDGVVKCPTCGSDNVSFVPSRRLWQCKTRHAKCQFSVKVGTIFEGSPIGLDKWLMAMWLIGNCKNGISSYEIHRDLGITQKSAWFMLHRIREAMRVVEPEKLGSEAGAEVEVDEAYVGGRAKNMHKSRRLKIQQELSKSTEWKQTSVNGKTAIMGMFDRNTRQIRAKVVPNTRRATLQTEILNEIHFGSRIYTDQAVAYDQLKAKYIHETVNHAEEYVRGQVHTNCLENFWSLTKRNLAGTYVCVEPFHLGRYLDEQMFRFNNRIYKTDADRLDAVARQVIGKRLTYAELTGKNAMQARPF